MAERYIVVPTSISCHCCFEATVMDTTKPEMLENGEQYTNEWGPHFETVCECFEVEDANRIAAALNAAGDGQAND